MVRRRRQPLCPRSTAVVVLPLLLLLVVVATIAPKAAAAFTRCQAEEGTPELAEAVARAVQARAGRVATAAAETPMKTIPTYFHVVAAYSEEDMAKYYPEDGQGYGGDVYIARQMDALNERYLPVGLQFRLDGVTRTYNQPKWATAKGGSSNYRAMVQALRVGDYGTLNVFVTDLGGGSELGYGTLPIPSRRAFDSVAVLWWTLPGGAQPPPPPPPPPLPPPPPPPPSKKNKHKKKKHPKPKPHHRSSKKGGARKLSDVSVVVVAAAAATNATNAPFAASAAAATVVACNPVFNLGMSLVHEVGHWLSLLHTFTPYDPPLGPSTGCSLPNDGVDDTPAVDKSNICCPTAPPQDTCPNIPNNGAALVNDYMDYTEDPCVNLFTPLQIERMVSAYAELREGVPL